MFQFLRHLSERVSKARPRQDTTGLGAEEGDFLLKVAQNVHRRLRPSDQLPGSLAEFQNTPVFAKYLERHGGFAQQRDMGLAMWLLAQVADQMLQGDSGRPRTSGGHWKVGDSRMDPVSSGRPAGHDTGRCRPTQECVPLPHFVLQVGQAEVGQPQP